MEHQAQNSPLKVAVGVTPEQLEKLSDYFRPSELEWRCGPRNRAKSHGIALCYVTARAVQQRLDDVCGPGNWKVEYAPTPHDTNSKSVLCGISIRVALGLGEWEWVTKWDGADNPATEPVKGGLSNATKRAGVPWGIGRYLYTLPQQWVRIDEYGNILEPPTLPAEFIPQGAEDETPAVAADGHEATNQEYDLMTDEQREALRKLNIHPAMPRDAQAKYRPWIEKPQTAEMAEAAYNRMQQLIRENGGDPEK